MARDATFAHFSERARAAGAVVVPAMAFYGGLGDLLATTAMDDGRRPTRCTSRTG